MLLNRIAVLLQLNTARTAACTPTSRVNHTVYAATTRNVLNVSVAGPQLGLDLSSGSTSGDMKSGQPVSTVRPTVVPSIAN